MAQPGVGPDEQGRNFALWPTHTFTFRNQTRRFDAEAYELRTATRAGAPPADPA